MRILFYLVHPAKYHFHKVQIKKLKENGHKVDILINTKDILEDLIKEEGWEYVNIFPNSRKIKGVHVYIAGFLGVFRTLFRLWKQTRKNKYDIFVGDLTTILGRLVNVPSFYPTDDVLAAVPEDAIFHKTVNYSIAPQITNLGRYNSKKIGYKGYKALAHLHPNHFTPDITKLSFDLRQGEPYFLIRCTGFGATHDINKTGINDEVLYELIKLLIPLGKILISSERHLPNNLSKYKININKSDMTHYIAFAKIFIGDSTTMSTEAAVLGTPSIEFDDYFYEIDQMIELEEKYNLIHCFRTSQKNEFLLKVQELVMKDNIKELYQSRRKKLLNDTIDVSAFLIWLFENYPSSVKEYFSNPDIQDRFR